MAESREPVNWNLDGWSEIEDDTLNDNNNDGDIFGPGDRISGDVDGGRVPEYAPEDASLPSVPEDIVRMNIIEERVRAIRNREELVAADIVNLKTNFQTLSDKFEAFSHSVSDTLTKVNARQDEMQQFMDDALRGQTDKLMEAFGRMKLETGTTGTSKKGVKKGLHKRPPPPTPRRESTKRVSPPPSYHRNQRSASTDDIPRAPLDSPLPYQAEIDAQKSLQKALTQDGRPLSPAPSSHIESILDEERKNNLAMMKVIVEEALASHLVPAPAVPTQKEKVPEQVSVKQEPQVKNHSNAIKRLDELRRVVLPFRGKGNPQPWIDNLEDNAQELNLPRKVLVNNLSNFFTGKEVPTMVEEWFTGMKVAMESMAGKGTSYEDIWLYFKDNMVQAFSTEAQVTQASNILSNIKYRPGDDPQEFVHKISSAMRIITPLCDDQSIIRTILDKLPPEVRHGCGNAPQYKNIGQFSEFFLGHAHSYTQLHEQQRKLVKVEQASEQLRNIRAEALQQPKVVNTPQSGAPQSVQCDYCGYTHSTTSCRRLNRFYGTAREMDKRVTWQDVLDFCVLKEQPRYQALVETEKIINAPGRGNQGGYNQGNRRPLQQQPVQNPQIQYVDRVVFVDPNTQQPIQYPQPVQHAFPPAQPQQAIQYQVPKNA